MTHLHVQWFTLAFLVAVSAIVIAVDVLLALRYGPDATISRAMQMASRRWPILYPVFWLWLGILAGHLGLPCEE